MLIVELTNFLKYGYWLCYCFLFLYVLISIYRITPSSNPPSSILDEILGKSLLVSISKLSNMAKLALLRGIIFSKGDNTNSILLGEIKEGTHFIHSLFSCANIFI